MKKKEPEDYLIKDHQIQRFTINTGIGLTQLKQIKNHDLNMLLTFSGIESIILSSYNDDWRRVKDWNPENRYKRQHITISEAKEFMISANRIFKQIV